MKKLIGILLLLALGIVLGYVFHNKIDTKLKARFGEEKVEAGKAKIKEGGEKVYDAGKAGVTAVQKELNTKTE
jgi:hypothetical protein